MFGFITESGERVIAVVIFSLGADLPVLSDDNGNTIVTDKNTPLLVENA